MRVLIVDDHPDCRESLGVLVGLWGHEISLARDAPSALATLNTFNPDVALVDIGLPGQDGWELGRVLKRSRPNLLLVAVTGFGQRQDEERSREVGFNAHLLKPVDPDQLQELLVWWERVVLPYRSARLAPHQEAG